MAFVKQTFPPRWSSMKGSVLPYCYTTTEAHTVDAAGYLMICQICWQWAI